MVKFAHDLQEWKTVSSLSLVQTSLQVSLTHVLKGRSGSHTYKTVSRVQTSGVHFPELLFFRDVCLSWERFPESKKRRGSRENVRYFFCSRSPNSYVRRLFGQIPKFLMFGSLFPVHLHARLHVTPNH